MLSASQCETVAFYHRDCGEFLCHACLAKITGAHSVARLEQHLESGWEEEFSPTIRYELGEFEQAEAEGYSQYLTQEFEHVSYDWDGSQWVFQAWDGELGEDEEPPVHSCVETFIHCARCSSELPNHAEPEQPVKPQAPTGPLVNLIETFEPVNPSPWLQQLAAIQALPEA